MARKMKAWRRVPRLAARLMRDRSGIAATEFAVILPMMLVLFFGVIEVTNGITVYRKVEIMAHTLSDLTSRSTSVADADLLTFFAASTGILSPYSTDPADLKQQTIIELLVLPNGQARVQWSVQCTPNTGTNTCSLSAPLAPGTPFPDIPSGLIPCQGSTSQTDGTKNCAFQNGMYVIYSSVTYKYQPVIGYVLNKAGFNLSDFSYTRPRQSSCVLYPVSTGDCPTS